MLLPQFSIGFPSTSNRDAPFHRMTTGFLRADQDDSFDYIRDVLWEISLI